MDKTRIKKFFMAILAIVLYLAIYIAMQLLVSTLSCAVLEFKYLGMGIRPSMSQLQSEVLKHTDAIVVISNLFSFLAYLLIFKLRKINIFRYCNYKKMKSSNIQLCIVTGIAASLFLGCLINLLPINQLFPEYAKHIKSFSAEPNILVEFISLCFAAPFFEELLFRGLILKKLKEISYFGVAVFIQALIFGIMHGNLLQGMYAFALGIILALVCTWTKSLWGSTIVHALFNLSNIFLVFITGKVGFIVVMILSFILTCYSLHAIYVNNVKYSET